MMIAEKSMISSYTHLLLVLLSTPTVIHFAQVLASWLGYGQTGPYRKAAGYDVIIEGEAGLMHM